MKIIFETVTILSLFVVLSCASFDKKQIEFQNKKNLWNESLTSENVSYVQWNKRLPNSLSVYQTDGLCGGLPKIKVKTAPGFCLGIVDSGSGLGMPRTALTLTDKQIVLTDMGSWEPNTGRLYLLSWNGHSYDRKLILSARTMLDKAKAKLMDRPHLVARGPDGKIYIGGAGVIGRLDPLAADVESTIQIVISGLPDQGIHPLKAFTFDFQKHRIFVNVGASTNVCQKQGTQGLRSNQCEEAESNLSGEAQVRVYQQLGDGSFDPNFTVYAKGLRNSMALYWDQELATLVQVDNGRDAIDKFNGNLIGKLLPHEELNLVQEGNHYGWPYCYDLNLNNPEWTHIDCSRYASPQLLLPPHSAPLSLIKYNGSLFPPFYKGRLLMSLHGYEVAGHRIVAMLRNENRLPTATPASVVYGWEASGEQLMGSPVGLSEMPDGSLLIVEDKSRKVLRLFYDAKLGDGAPVRELDKIDFGNKDNESFSADVQSRKNKLDERLRADTPPVFSVIQRKLIDKHCVVCHGGAGSPGIKLLAFDDVGNADRIINENKAAEILARVSQNPNYPQMPPQGIDSEEERKNLTELIQNWINQGMPRP